MRIRLSRADFPRRDRAGSSLIEVLIGIAILGIALLGLAELFLISVSNNTRGGEVSHATFLAQQEVDYLRTLTATELSAFPSTARGESADESIDMNQDGTLDYRRLTRIQASGYSYTVRIVIFPASRIGTAAATLLQDPASYRASAVMNAVIGR